MEEWSSHLRIHRHAHAVIGLFHYYYFDPLCDFACGLVHDTPASARVCAHNQSFARLGDTHKAHGTMLIMLSRAGRRLATLDTTRSKWSILNTCWCGTE